ncbi:MAG TPA: hydrogenase nickel incorporation protein HypB [Ignavibacteriaceae bacterium]|nr:hydrogenase nickel incorporation protein HypB [Ignavibacteriaceae bacterium]
MSVITVERKVLEKNDQIASALRVKFKSKGLFVINLLSSPGSGKTSLIEKTADHLKGKLNISVIVGDVQTDNDAKRIGKLNIPVVQIITHGSCHLEAQLVRDAYTKIENEPTDLLIIENVGNLVCPAGYDLGEDKKVVIISTTEGDDKPLKYPAMFRNSSAMVINKIDLLPYVNSSVEEIKNNARSINSELGIFQLSCKTSEGIEEWCNWILNQIKK